MQRRWNIEFWHYHCDDNCDISFSWLSCVLEEGELPWEWKSANVVPIYKKGSKHLPINYRPVSLTCICSKTMEYIMVSQIARHLDEHNILLRNQHGFRNGLSCETQLLEFVQELHESQHAWVQIDAIVTENVRKLEMVQCLGARWVLGRYHNRSSVTSMLEKLNWRSLERCRADSRQVMLYKMANSLVTIDAYPPLSAYGGHPAQRSST